VKSETGNTSTVSRRKHHDLLVWQEAIGLVKEVYKATEKFPQHEVYGLSSQLRRAAVSVPSNIAEGAARRGDNEFLQYLSISRGSLSEVETQLIIANELGYLNDFGSVMEHVEKLFGLINGLIKSIQSRKKI
jgi:four helix bundle protein